MALFIVRLECGIQMAAFLYIHAYGHTHTGEDGCLESVHESRNSVDIVGKLSGLSRQCLQGYQESGCPKNVRCLGVQTV